MESTEFFGSRAYGCSGASRDRLGGGHLHHVALLHDPDAVGYVVSGGEVIGNVDSRPAEAVARRSRLTIEIRSNASTIDTGLSAMNAAAWGMSARAIATLQLSTGEPMGLVPADRRQGPADLLQRLVHGTLDALQAAHAQRDMEARPQVGACDASDGTGNRTPSVSSLGRRFQQVVDLRLQAQTPDGQ
ncbi:MAG: hypothetical protein OXJ90_17710 [Spirochaetaceae bacterium]|nr:hypothetical protein [Spirochaetaceae bacterium]